jgi:hypothetical protein
MKRITALCLVFIALFPAAFAWGSGPSDVQTDPSSSTQTKPWFTIADELFYALEDSFFQPTFIGNMKTVDLSESETLVFNSSREQDRLLPNLYITMSLEEPFEVNMEMIKAMVVRILGVTDYLQEAFPEEPLFNVKMMEDRAKSGLGYMVAEPDIWLLPESCSAVMIPVCFFDNESGNLVDDIYLLEVVATEEGALRYALYNNLKYVGKYIENVKISSDGSPFQAVLVQWYLQNYLEIMWEEIMIGTVCVVTAVGYVGEKDNINARVVARVWQGEEYPALTETENGWYLIRYAYKVFGFISPKQVEFFTKTEV